MPQDNDISILRSIERIHGEISTISEITHKTELSVVKIEEHLRNLNGTIVRHDKKLEKLENRIENEIKELSDDVVKTKISNAQLYTRVTMISVAVGFIITIVVNYLVR